MIRCKPYNCICFVDRITATSYPVLATSYPAPGAKTLSSLLFALRYTWRHEMYWHIEILVDFH